MFSQTLARSLRILLYFFCLKNSLKISVDFIRQIMRSETDSTIFFSYIKILYATKDKGGNLPHIKALSLILGRSESTTKRHLKLLLEKGWIRNNHQKDGAYTIVSFDRLLNTDKVKVVCLKVGVDVMGYSLVRFRAFLSEAIYQQQDNRKRAKEKYKKIQEKYKEQDKEYKRAIQMLLVNTKTYISLKGSKIKTKKDKGMSDKQIFTFKVIKLVGDVDKKYYNISYDIETGESSIGKFFKDEEFNLVNENVKLRIDELLGAGSCKPENVAESPCSYSFRAYMINKSSSTVRKYQSEFPNYYVKSERIITDKNLMIQHGKYIGNIFGIQTMKFNKAFNQTPTKRKYKSVGLSKCKINLR